MAYSEPNSNFRMCTEFTNSESITTGLPTGISSVPLRLDRIFLINFNFGNLARFLTND